MRVAVQLDNGEVAPTRETAQAVQAASDALKNCGMIVSPCELPDEGMSLIRQIWRSNGGEMSASELYQILGEWDAFRSKMLASLADFDREALLGDRPRVRFEVHVECFDLAVDS